MEYVFVSPHLDDAILSCGALISSLTKKKSSSVVSVFTEADEKYINAAGRSLLKSSHYSDAQKLFSDRRREDINLGKYLGINIKHLGFIDAGWRHTYNLEQDIFAGKVKTTWEEIKLEGLINSKLNNIVNKNSIVFCPLGVGSHVDHLITRNICDKLFPNVIYWQDYPYNLSSNPPSAFINKNKLDSFSFQKNLYLKEKLIKIYRSQMAGIFGVMPIVLRKEVFYCKN